MPKKAANTETASAESPQTLNPNELRFIKAVFDNMTQKPDANWDNVAACLSLKDAKCAKERWRQLSVRHGWRESNGGGGGSATAAKGKTSGGGVTKPARTPRKPRAKKEPKVKEEEEPEEEGEDLKEETDVSI